MTPKQEAFVTEYLIDLNATQAAIRAGYSPRTANEQGARLLAKASVRAAIEKAKQERSERVQLDQDYVIRVIQETIERCAQHRPVVDALGNPVRVETPDGSIAAAYKFDPQAVLKGAELLGKHLGIFIEKRELTGKDGEPLAPSAPTINLTLKK